MTLPPGVSNRFVRLWHPHCICRVSCIHPPGCWYRAQALTTFSSSSGKKMRYGSSLWKSLWTESTSLQSSASHCRHLDGRKKKEINITEMKAHSRFNCRNQFLLSCNVIFFPSFCHMKMREKLLTVTCRQPLEIRFSKNSNCWLDDPEAIQEEKTLHHNFVGKSWRASREWYLNAMKWCPSSLREGCLGCAQLRLCWSWKGCYLKQNIEIMSLNANLHAKQRID